jgi:hypothetical protein
VQPLERIIHRQELGSSCIVTREPCFDLGCPHALCVGLWLAVQALDELLGKLSSIILGERERFL